MIFEIPSSELEALERRVQAALSAADQGDLSILGYGEVTLVLQLLVEGEKFACKRLPIFPTEARFGRYRQLLEEYVNTLRKSGVCVAETRLWHRNLPGGRVVAYCIQRALPSENLCSKLLHSRDRTWAERFFERFLDIVEATASPTVGLDAQASNWIEQEGELVYLDVTTPLLRDERGREQLDVRLFLTSLPWGLRDAVRIFMSKSIFDKFYTHRGVIVDFLGNLHKERLTEHIPSFVEAANARLMKEISEAEVGSYYKEDARMWELLQRLRRADRFWQRKVLGRVYPFLLPPSVQR